MGSQEKTKWKKRNCHYRFWQFPVLFVFPRAEDLFTKNKSCISRCRRHLACLGKEKDFFSPYYFTTWNRKKTHFESYFRHGRSLTKVLSTSLTFNHFFPFLSGKKYLSVRILCGKMMILFLKGSEGNRGKSGSFYLFSKIFGQWVKLH